MIDKIQQEEFRVLARKYRPQTFGDLIGQETLVRTLTNAISNNRIAHAYLLTGIRGIGKTTAARIIAMNLNCENRIQEKCEPCGKCDSCVSVREDRNLDVIEMDAASKTGVDDIREIIDNVKYKPVSSKYKIFIIDEVHMLSKNAFNALLKTLEEPPAHVKFIFATTEVKKIPITIISRCQRFDLHRIATTVLTTHLMSIAKKENINVDRDAMALIVRSADGSVRDGLSLLDQAIANEKEKITANSIIEMLGLADRGNIFDLMDAIFQGNSVKALEIFNRIHQAGADVVMIFDEMLNVTHFITQIKIAPELKEDIHIPELERTKGFEMAEKISMASLGMIWQVLFRGYQELQSGFHLFQHGEMIIIRLIYLYDGPSPSDLLKEIEKDKKLSLNMRTSSESFPPIQKDPIVNKVSDKNNEVKEKREASKKDFPKPAGVLTIKSYRNFVDLFYQKREGLLHTYLYNNVKLVSFKEGEVVVNVKSIVDPHFTRTVAKLVSTWTGRIWQVSTSTSNVGLTLYEEDCIQQQKEIEKMKNEPEVKDILEKFPGVTIHTIADIHQTVDETVLSAKNKQTKEK
ncbi:DNA polymerase III subunit gamma/tau [Alphaproteobacteria bacterium]|nr:DNA polymerase III subunit gamma/tau [Alphaproteobacteria bacterium]